MVRVESNEDKFECACDCDKDEEEGIPQKGFLVDEFEVVLENYMVVCYYFKREKVVVEVALYLL